MANDDIYPVGHILARSERVSLLSLGRQYRDSIGYGPTYLLCAGCFCQACVGEGDGAYPYCETCQRSPERMIPARDVHDNPVLSCEFHEKRGRPISLFEGEPDE
jgi:hypothetical protein